MKITGYIKALEELAGLMGDNITVDDGATNWTLWCLIDACKEGGQESKEMLTTDYAITTKGIYAIGDDGYIKYPPVIRVIS